MIQIEESKYAEMVAELEAARAKLAKLPRTKDGVEIVPGMVVYLECPDPGWWDVDPGTILETTVESITSGKGFAEYEGDFTIGGCDLEFGNLDCFSTHAAADAALAAKDAAVVANAARVVVADQKMIDGFAAASLGEKGQL
jgi:hypothetical protein